MVTAAEAQAELARRRGQTPPPPPAPAPAAPAPAAAAGSITPDVARQELEKRKQATEQQPGVVEDVIRSAGGGLRRAGEAVAGTFGDIQAAGEGMSNWMMRRLGYTDEDIAKAEQLKSNIIPGPPSTSDVAAATTQMVGPSYKPRTKPGEYVSSIAEQAGALVGPGSWAAKGAQMVGSGLPRPSARRRAAPPTPSPALPATLPAASLRALPTGCRDRAPSPPSASTASTFSGRRTSRQPPASAPETPTSSTRRPLPASASAASRSARRRPMPSAPQRSDAQACRQARSAPRRGR
jgi:hypothetical protein